MNIYDFDGTIYDGDSSVNFIKYCLKIKKECYLVLPKYAVMFLLYKLKIIKKETMKSAFFSIINYFDDIEKIVFDFWEQEKYKLKDYYLKQKKDTDIIISASPEFLLSPVAEYYHFALIATKVDLKSGKIIGKNCHGEEKVKRLNEEMHITECEEFYSDALCDAPLSKIAKKAFIVDGEKLIPWNEYKK